MTRFPGFKIPASLKQVAPWLVAARAEGFPGFKIPASLKPGPRAPGAAPASRFPGFKIPASLKRDASELVVHLGIVFRGLKSRPH